MPSDGRGDDRQPHGGQSDTRHSHTLSTLHTIRGREDSADLTHKHSYARHCALGSWRGDNKRMACRRGGNTLRRGSISSVVASLLVCIVLLLQGNLAGADGSFSYTIPYGTEECLLIRAPNEESIIGGSFDCLDSKVATDPIRVALYNSNEERVWQSEYGDAEGYFSHKGSGKHWLCLENGMTYEHYTDTKVGPRLKVARTIGFALRVKRTMNGMREALGDAADGSDANDTTRKLMELSEDLSENFQALTDHMSYMKAREIVHRELHEETFTKVVRWNILEICAVVVVSFGQIVNVWYIMSKRSNSYY